MNRLRIDIAAERDLDEIWHFVGVARQNPVAADRILDMLQQKFRLLAENPRGGQARDDLAPGVRIYPAEKYVILFRPLEDGVEIVQVVHGARDLNAIFRPLDD